MVDDYTWCPISLYFLLLKKTASVCRKLNDCYKWQAAVLFSLQALFLSFLLTLGNQLGWRNADLKKGWQWDFALLKCKERKLGWGIVTYHSSSAELFVFMYFRLQVNLLTFLTFFHLPSWIFCPACMVSYGFHVFASSLSSFSNHRVIKNLKVSFLWSFQHPQKCFILN